MELNFEWFGFAFKLIGFAILIVGLKDKQRKFGRQGPLARKLGLAVTGQVDGFIALGSPGTIFEQEANRRFDSQQKQLNLLSDYAVGSIGLEWIGVTVFFVGEVLTMFA